MLAGAWFGRMRCWLVGYVWIGGCGVAGGKFIRLGKAGRSLDRMD
jgi:hypothetical protein